MTKTLMAAKYDREAEQRRILERDARIRRQARPRQRKACSNCNGEGWFTTQHAGTVMCSECRGKGHK